MGQDAQGALPVHLEEALEDRGTGLAQRFQHLACDILYIGYNIYPLAMLSAIL